MLQNKRPLYECCSAPCRPRCWRWRRIPNDWAPTSGLRRAAHLGQTLTHHPHIHCVVPAGGFAPVGASWVRLKSAGLFLKRCSAEVFRGKFDDGLKELFRRKMLGFHGSWPGWRNLVLRAIPAHAASP